MGLSTTGDGRPILTGSSCLPPMVTRPKAETNGKSQDKAAPKRKTADRFAVLNAFVDSSMAECSRSELVVWFILYRDTRNGSVRTSQANIARRAGMSVRSVGKAIAKLTAAGFLVVVFKGGLNRGPSRYRVRPLRNRSS